MKSKRSRKGEVKRFHRTALVSRRLGIYNIISTDVGPNYCMNLASTAAFDRPI